MRVFFLIEFWYPCPLSVSSSSSGPVVRRVVSRLTTEIAALAKEHYQNEKEVGFMERVKVATDADRVHAAGGRELPS